MANRFIQSQQNHPSHVILATDQASRRDDIDGGLISLSKTACHVGDAPAS